MAYSQDGGLVSHFYRYIYFYLIHVRLGTEEERTWGPAVTRKSWDSYLRSSGFSGLDLAFPVGKNPGRYSTMISTALAPSSTQNYFPRAIILASTQSLVQIKTAKKLQIHMNNFFPACDIFPLDDIEAINGEYTICVALLEIEDPCLYQISERTLTALKHIFSSFETIIWASSQSSTTVNPLNSTATGFARCLREENGTSHGWTAGYVKSITSFETCIPNITENLEPEFIEINGLLCINRIAELDELNNLVARQTTQQLAQLKKFREGELRPMKLTMGQPGLLSSFQYQAIDPRSASPLGVDKVEVEVKASGVNFRDVLIALGQDPASFLPGIRMLRRHH